MSMNARLKDALALSPDSPRVEACITEVMQKHPGESKASLAKYFEAVHQELAPLARELERENRQLRDQIQTIRNHTK
ncbi:hypothetical protein [Pandoraea apista]|uniref:hypothetical protein n=1 Tax=Pandoraea apista TaxID=93218 RepID=UPI000F68B3E0|nr:hypothetical protein [Pandoraea apista]RRW98960.1 hypothetical protein EGJ56_22580 [Pandoraea apista]